MQFVHLCGLKKVDSLQAKRIHYQQAPDLHCLKKLEILKLLFAGDYWRRNQHKKNRSESN